MWIEKDDFHFCRSDGVSVMGLDYGGAKPWWALRNRPKGAPHHREDKDTQWLRRQNQFGFWGIVRRFATAEACMAAVDKDWPLKTKAKAA